MLTPPADLPTDLLASTVARHWDIVAAGLRYRPVGWGSHHWEVTGPAGQRWFLTVDDLAAKRRDRDEPVGEGFERLRSALATVGFLSGRGHRYAIGPLSTVDGEPVVRVGGYGVALYPFVDGRSYDWGEWASPGYRREVLDLVIDLHRAPTGPARADDFRLPHGDELADALAGRVDPAAGPYAGRLGPLVAGHADRVQGLLDRYAALVAGAGAAPRVLTHGEPHPGNTIRTAAGLVLIDWETVLVAPPERDLWHLDPGDGSLLAAYAEATGVTPDGRRLELYRVRWDLTDIAIEVGRFRRPHRGTPDDDQAWALLSRLVTSLPPAGGPTA